MEFFGGCAAEKNPSWHTSPIIYDGVVASEARERWKSPQKKDEKSERGKKTIKRKRIMKEKNADDSRAIKPHARVATVRLRERDDGNAEMQRGVRNANVRSKECRDENVATKNKEDQRRRETSWDWTKSVHERNARMGVRLRPG